MIGKKIQYKGNVLISIDKLIHGPENVRTRTMETIAFDSEQACRDWCNTLMESGIITFYRILHGTDDNWYRVENLPMSSEDLIHQVLDNMGAPECITNDYVVEIQSWTGGPPQPEGNI